MKDNKRIMFAGGARPQNPHHVLILADYRTPCSGNFIASLLELGERIRDLGGQVFFLFPENRTGGGYSWSDWLEANGFSVTLVNDRLPQEQILDILRQLIRENQIRIVHTHFGMYHHLLMQNARELGVKVLVHDHMDFSPEGNLQKQKLRTLLLSAVYRAKGIHVVSVMELKSRAYALCGKRYSHYVPNGLSLRRNGSENMSRDDLRREWGIGRSDRICLLLGWDKYRKGMDVAVKAVEEFRKSDPTLHLGIIGVGSPPWQDTVDWIREKTGVDPSCGWLHFLPSYEDIFACHRAVDVYLSASRKEAFSYGLLEAISQNTPVVVSDIEGTRWAQAYSKAATYPVEDPHLCAQAMGQALAMGREPSNQDAMTEKYSIGFWCDRILQLYDSV